MEDSEQRQKPQVDLQWLRGAGSSCWDCTHALGGYDGLICTLWQGAARGWCEHWKYEPGCDEGVR